MKLDTLSTPALRLDLLQPGDVVLSRGKGKNSVTNVLLQSPNRHRRFSHAAIVVTPTEWMESLDDGVLFTPICIDKIEQDDCGYRALHLIDKKDYSEIAVFRYAPLRAFQGSGRWEHVSNTLQNQGSLEFGKEYSKLCNLAKASPILRNSGILHRTALALAMTAERMKIAPKRWNPGLFCSELVATLYMSLRDNVDPTINLLKETRAPFEISPSDLGDPDLTNLSELTETDVIVEERDCPNAAPPTGWSMARHLVRGRGEGSRNVFAVRAGVSLAQVEELCKNMDVSIEHLMESLGTFDLEALDADDDGIHEKKLTDNVEASQQLINDLWSNFDRVAADERWDPNHVRSEIINRTSQYQSLILRQLREAETFY